MTSELMVRERPEAGALAEQVLLKGDLAQLSEEQRAHYYTEVCRSLGLNPMTRPFELITLNGRLTLYARRDAADQLRKLNGISVQVLRRETTPDGLHVVTARASDRLGRVDESIGAVNVKGLGGESLANALMKAETKAKRRVTLSIAGLGWLDEVEVEDAGEDPDAPAVEAPLRGRARLRARLGAPVERIDSEVEPETIIAAPPPAPTPEEAVSPAPDAAPETGGSGPNAAAPAAPPDSLTREEFHALLDAARLSPGKVIQAAQELYGRGAGFDDAERAVIASALGLV